MVCTGLYGGKQRVLSFFNSTYPYHLCSRHPNTNMGTNNIRIWIFEPDDNQREIVLSTIQPQTISLSQASTPHWRSVTFDQVPNHIYVWAVQTPGHFCWHISAYWQVGELSLQDSIQPGAARKDWLHQHPSFCSKLLGSKLSHTFRSTVQFYFLSSNIAHCLNEESPDVFTSRKPIWAHINPKASHFISTCSKAPYLTFVGVLEENHLTTTCTELFKSENYMQAVKWVLIITTK